MLKRLATFLTAFFLFLNSNVSLALSEIVKKIEISGNDRISDEVILMFSDVDLGQDIKNSKVNEIRKNLYETKFFNNVSVTLENNLISITVDEAPLIENVIISGIKAKKIRELIRENFILKTRTSFNEFQLL